MEENPNTSVDLSDFLNSPKKQVSAGKLSKKEKAKQKNKIYVAIIIGCFLIMAALWAYYWIQGRN
jgi:hypothetical protein